MGSTRSMRGEGGHGGDGGSGRKSGLGSSEAVSGHMPSLLVSWPVGTGSSGSVTAEETDVAFTVGEWIHPSPPTSTPKYLSGGSQSTVIMLAVPERFECERENPRKMFGVVWAVDTPRASETRMDMAERECLSVAPLSFLSFLNN